MGHKALIAILALIPTLLLGQPMSISELAWPQVTPTNAPIICGVAATNSFVAVAENSPVHFTLQGLGGTFAISSGPSSGALSGLDTSSGAVTYTPNLNFIGSDQFTFSVSSNSCITNATVYLATYDTNSTNQTCVTVTGVSTASASGTNCFTVYTNGVLQSSTCDDAFDNIGGSDGFDGIICVGRSSAICMGLSGDFSTVAYSTNFVTHSCSDLYSSTKSLGSSSLNTISFGVTNTSGSGVGYVAQDFSFGFCNATGTNKQLHITGLVSWDVWGQGGIGICVYTNGFVCGNGATNTLIRNVASGEEVSNNIPFTLDVPLIDGHVYPSNSILIEFRVQGGNSGSFERKFWGSATNTLQ
jgi:hypothetical protein